MPSTDPDPDPDPNPVPVPAPRTNKTPATVSVSVPNKSSAIPTRLFGANMVYIYEDDTSWNDSLYDAIYMTRGAFLRYPGGEIVSSYDWKNPTGAWRDSWGPNFNGVYESEEDFMDFDEYFAHMKAFGVTPVVGINTDSGLRFDRVDDSVKSARDLVAHAKELGGVWLWYIDNEPYHYSGRAQLTATEYADMINRHVFAMKQVAPGIHIIANWIAQWRGSWKTLLNAAGANIDILDIHTYWSWDDPTWERYLADGEVRYNNVRYRDFLKDFRNKLDQNGYRDKQLGLFEWGLGNSNSVLNKSDRMSPVESALVASDMFIDLINSDAVDFASYHPFHVLGSAYESSHMRTLLTDDYQKTPMLRFLQLFATVKRYHDLAESMYTDDTLNVLTAKKRSNNEFVTDILHRAAVDAPVQLDLPDCTVKSASVVALMAPNGNTKADTEDRMPIESTYFGNSVVFTVPGWSLTRATVGCT